MAGELLRHGVATVHLPKDVVLAGSHHAERTVGFVGALHHGASLVSVSLANNRRSTDVALRSAGISQLPLRMFSLSSSTAMCRYAKQVGYPVVLRPVTRDHREPPTVPLKNEADLTGAIETWTTRKSPPRRVVVSAYPTGRHYWVLLARNSILAWAEYRGWGGAARSTSASGQGSGLPTEIERLALTSAAAVPGLGMACIDIVETRSGLLRRSRRHNVVEIDAEPSLTGLGVAVAPELLARRLVRAELDHAGVSADEPTDQRGFEVTCEDLTNLGQVPSELATVARETEIATTDIVVDERRRAATLQVEGECVKVARMAVLLARRGTRSTPVPRVRCVPAPASAKE